MSGTNLAGDAAELAADAAERADVRVDDLEDDGDLAAIARLLQATALRHGSDPSDSLPGPGRLAALARDRGQVAGARRGDELVGATVGSVHVDEDGGQQHWSHRTAVAADARGQGVGRALKLHERAWCLARGINVVRWRLDPLVRRDVVFSLVVLGARAVGYERSDERREPQAGGAEPGGAAPADHLLVEWPLDGPRVRAALRGRPAQPDVGAVRRAGAEVVLDVSDDGGPLHDPGGAERRLMRIPADIDALREGDPALAARWADAIREHLGGAMEAGMRVTGATRDGWYLLAAAHDVRELAEPR